MVNIGLFTSTIALIISTATVALPVPLSSVSSQSLAAESAASAESHTGEAKNETTALALGVKTKVKILITAYSSSPDETDDTPFVTASGKRVYDGVIATNLFPFGTKARIPSLFGDKIFIIEDRMHHRFNDRVDIWMPSKSQALEFGKKTAEIEILN